MTLIDIENDIKFSSQIGILKESHLSSINRERVQNGENYHIDCLFTYMSDLGMILLCNNERINNKEELGRYLKNQRLSAHMTKLDMEIASTLSTSAIDIIEIGKGYKRNTFMKYINQLNIDFDVEYK